MHTLRSLNPLRWWVVAWFILSLGVTLASPLVQPRGMEVVCSTGSGVTLVVHADADNAVLDAMGMDCTLCLLGSAPPQPAIDLRAFPPPHHALPWSPLKAQVIVPMAAAPPARAPPSLPV